MRVGSRAVSLGLISLAFVCGQSAAHEPAGMIPSAEAKSVRLSPERKESQALSIHVLPGDWGDADRQDIEHLLRAVARELWVYFPDRKLRPITVAPNRGTMIWRPERIACAKICAEPAPSRSFQLRRNTPPITRHRPRKSVETAGRDSGTNMNDIAVAR